MSWADEYPLQFSENTAKQHYNTDSMPVLLILQTI